jgi:ribonuclease VapC
MIVDSSALLAVILGEDEFGRGNHPARLNFGDCIAYALAKLDGDTLLFKGGDFAQTDVEPALKG